MVREITYVIGLSVIMLLSGCGGLLKTEDPRVKADKLAHTKNFNKRWLKTSQFTFLSYQKITAAGQPVHVYIEGDGRSYLSKYKISNDPTPHQPLGLKLALQDPSPNVVYLARPCQYTDRGEAVIDNPNNPNLNCRPEVWSTLRFSEPVIAAMNQAIQIIKEESKAKAVDLIGFSGGAAVAVLIAARRHDIGSLRTVAGDLDHQQMSAYHKTSPLDPRSLNPKHYAQKIAHIPQHHFSGKKDTIVPSFIAENFVKEVNKTKPGFAKAVVLPNATHQEGWEEVWVTLLHKDF